MEYGSRHCELTFIRSRRFDAHVILFRIVITAEHLGPRESILSHATLTTLRDSVDDEEVSKNDFIKDESDLLPSLIRRVIYRGEWVWPSQEDILEQRQNRGRADINGINTVSTLYSIPIIYLCVGIAIEIEETKPILTVMNNFR